MSDQILSNLNGVIDLQLEGPGGGNRYVLDVATDIKPTLTGLDVSWGSVNREYRVSARSNRYVPRPARRGKPDPIEPELSMKMLAWNYLEQCDQDSRIGLYVRYVDTTCDPQDPLAYSRIDIVNSVALGGLNFGDITTGDGDEEDRMITVPLNGAAHIRIDPVVGRQIASGWSNADDCNVVVSVLDSDGTLYAVTAADGVGGSPFLVKTTDGGATWTEVELTGLSVDCTSIDIAGQYLIISAATSVCVYTKAGVLSNEYTAAGNIAAVKAIDAANIVAVGASGLALLSDDGGITWTTLTTGVSTALSRIAVRNINDFFIGGATGTLLHYERGTISALVLPTGPVSEAVNQIALPDSPAGFNRDDEVFIGSANGSVWMSDEDGATGSWTQVPFPGDDAGTVADLVFVEFLGQVLYVLHTTPGGSSVLYRDWSGGVGGNNNMEQVTVPTNSGMNTLAVADANNAYIMGDVHSGSEMVIKVERA